MPTKPLSTQSPSDEKTKKLKSLVGFRSSWYYGTSGLMWACIISAVIQATPPTNTGGVFVALFVALALWCLQTVIFTDANYRELERLTPLNKGEQ